jgi:ethanolamine utilization microcompartment shell protein EutS
VTSSNDGNPTAGPVEIVVQCPVVPPPLGINIDKGGPDLSHVGDVVTYTFAVSLTTGVPLHAVVVTDPNCDAGAPAYVSGDDGDVVLEPGEVWRYTCDHLVTEDDPDPLPNTATVSGTSGDGRTVSDQDNHLVDLIHPDIRIIKTVDPPSGEPGDVVTFSYEVRNTGDTSLYDVHVDDDVIGPIGVIGVLGPGETVVLTKEWELPGDAIDIVNVGTASGTDVLGEEVSDDDDAVVTIVEAATPPAPPRPTAFTGSDALSLGALAGLLLFAGLLAITVARRRRDVTA